MIIIAGITTTTIIFLSIAFLPFWRRCNSAVLDEDASVLWLFSYLFVTKTTAVHCHANLNSAQRFLYFHHCTFSIFVYLYLYLEYTVIFRDIPQELAWGLFPFIAVGSSRANFLWQINFFSMLECFWFDPPTHNIDQMRWSIKSIIVQPHIINSNPNVGHHITKYLN